MSVAESTSRQLVLTSGSTSLTLDKDASKATLQRKLLFWKLKPVEISTFRNRRGDDRQNGRSSVERRNLQHNVGHPRRH